MKREHSTRLFQHAIIVTVNDQRDVFFEVSLVVSGNRISKVGPTDAVMEELRCEGYFDVGDGTLEVIDCSGKIIFPGFISTHNHLFQTLFKGCSDDMELAD